MDLDDDDLMLLARSSNQQAFEALVKRHQTFVYALATRYQGTKTSGRDVAQDVFLALWAERERYKPQGRFRSYLISLTLHRCHALARKTRTRDAHAQSERQRQTTEAPEPGPPLERLVEHEKARMVRGALARVPTEHRQVLILRFTHDLSLEEIANTTGSPLGTVKSLLFRGLKRLRRLLDQESSS